jgi:deoxyribonuclease V
LLVAVDAQYSEEHAGVACVAFSEWSAAAPDLESTAIVHAIEPYMPGEFWRRELPCILQVLGTLQQMPAIVVVDGYVWLDAHGRKGLGAHLFDALGAQCAVVGVAKHAFHGASNAATVLRGGSKRPLYVTAQGIALDVAEAGVRQMVGNYRVPTLLKRVDQLCRESLRNAAP